MASRSRDVHSYNALYINPNFSETCLWLFHMGYEMEQLNIIYKIANRLQTQKKECKLKDQSVVTYRWGMPVTYVRALGFAE